VTGILAGAGIALAWLGAAILVLSHARRGLAVGTLVGTLGLALALALEGGPIEAGVLLAGGLLGAVAGLRRNPNRGWGLLQVPSTPRVVLAVVLGAGALWLAIGVLDWPGASQPRAAALIVLALGAGRLLGEREPRAALAAASLMALGAGTLAALAAGALPGAVAGALAAVALNLLPTMPESELESG
jgi:hypothetical protein